MSPIETDIDKARSGDSGENQGASEGANPELRREAAELLLSLDRLMTIGTYYQPGHVRHQAVADECEETVQRSLRRRPVIEIELAEDGIRLFDQHFPAACREARRLFSLLEPLSMGQFTIHPGITADQLHQALAALQTHKNSLSGSHTYEELAIEGLPASVSTVGRSLFLRTKKGPGGGAPLIDPNIIPTELLLPGADIQKSEREFLKVMNGILSNKNLKNVRLGGDGPGAGGKSEKGHEGSGGGGGGGDGGSGRGSGGGGPSRQVAGPKFDVDEWVPEAAIATIGAIIEALAGTNSDPMVFEHLIAHAKTALNLTNDPELVELVFQKLRKDWNAKNKPQPKLIGKSAAQKRKDPGIKYALSTEELRALIDGMEVPYGPHQDPEAQDRANVLGICMHLMNSAPSDELMQGIRNTVRRIFSGNRFGGPEKKAAAAVLVQVFSRDLTEQSLRTFEMIFQPLWEFHPESVGPVWLAVWRRLPPIHRDRIWPYTVNDLLLGLKWHKPLEALALYGAVSRVKTAGKSRLMYTLENLPALQEGVLSEEFFSPPPPLLFPVLQALIGSSISAKLGPELHEHLLRLQTHPLAVVMLEAATEYHPGNRVVYQAILEQGLREKITPRMEEIAGRLLSLALLRLPSGDRKEPWIKDAIFWLGKLAPANASEVFNKICTEKRFWVLPAWPKVLRETAEETWLTMGDPADRAGESDALGAYDVENEDADIFEEPAALSGAAPGRNER